MSLRTRRGLGLWASILLVVAACSGTATPSPATPPPATPAPVVTPAASAVVTPAPVVTPAASAPAETPAGSAPAETAAASAPASEAPSTAPTPAGTPCAPAPVTTQPSAAPAPSLAPGTPDAYSALFGSTYKPKPGKPGGQLVMGEWQPASQLNAYFTTAFTNYEALGPVQSNLVSIDSQGKFFPDLAVSIPTPQNGGIVMDANCGFTMFVNIKPGLLWSDGQPMTLKDFKFSYDWAVKVAKAGIGCTGCATTVPVIDTTIDPKNVDAYWGPDNQYIQSMTVSDDGLSMVVVWKKNYAGWLGWLGSVILPEHYFSSIPIDQNLVTSIPVGPGIEKVPWSGPFTITSASSDGIDYARNPNYKARDHQAYLDTLRFKFYGSKDGEIAAFLNGEIDMAYNLSQADYPAIKGVDPKIGTAELTPAWQYEHFDLNNADTKNGLDNLAVRAAIAAAVDKQGLIDVLFPGQPVTPACGFAPPGTWYRIEVTCPPYDATAAGKALDAAGWPLDSNGVRALGGDTTKEMRMQLCTTAGNPTRLTELSKLNSNLLAIGIPSDITTADASSVVFAGWADTTPTTQCSIYRGNYSIADFAYILGGDLYSNLFPVYHSSQIPSDANPNGSNDTRFNDPAMDKAIETLSTAVDPNDQFSAAVTVQKAYAAGIPEIPIYYRAETTGVGVSVGNWPGYNPSSVGPTWNTQDWYVIK